MKNKLLYGYLLVAILFIFAGIFDNHYPNFPISMLRLVVFASGSIIYLVSGGLSGYSQSERILYEKYVDDHRDQREKDLYPRFNLKKYLFYYSFQFYILLLN